MHAARLEAICESGACDARTVLDAKVVIRSHLPFLALFISE